MRFRILSLVGAAIVLLGSMLLAVRPWYLAWGATSDEMLRPLPGDEIIANARGQQTRAITIHAPLTQVWPWLAQIGQDRGGFYSFDLLENLIGCEMPTTERLQPDKQVWRIGDKLWMYPKHKPSGLAFSGIGFATLRAYLPGRSLVFGTHMVGTSQYGPESGSWAFVLESLDASTTRMLIRGRAASDRSLPGRIFDLMVFEPVHFVMEQRLMIGLQETAEGKGRNRMWNHALVALWLIAFLELVAAVVLVLRRNRWGRSFAGFLAAAVVLQFLLLVQPPLTLGLVCVGAAGAILPWRNRPFASAEHASCGAKPADQRRVF